MKPWYDFLQAAGTEPELIFGLYEVYVSQRGFGPTSAERALVHTPMLELDHERRFASTQMNLDHSRHEIEHPRRISSAIDYFLETYTRYDCHRVCFNDIIHDDDLIGLVPSPVVCDLPEYPNSLAEISLTNVEQRPRCATASATPLVATTPISQSPRIIPDIISVDESGIDDEGSADFWAEEVRVMSKDARQRSGKLPRQLTGIRCRKDAKPNATMLRIKKHHREVAQLTRHSRIT